MSYIAQCYHVTSCFVGELHYKFVDGSIAGECKTWLYMAYRRSALILDYWCDISDLYEKLLRFVLDDLKLHYNTEIVYLHAVGSDGDEKKLLGKVLRKLGFIMVDNEYALLIL